MDLPAFAIGRLAVPAAAPRQLVIHTDEVAFTAHTSWYSRSWTVTGMSELALPADVIVYIAHAGGSRGFWRNVKPRLTGYFAYCDMPALMPLLVGRQTWRAINEHDAPRDGGKPHGSVALHIHGGEIETTTKVDPRNSRVIDDQIAIHRALAADHAEVVAAWRSAADELRGSVATTWPPVLTVPRGFGSTTIALRWSPSTHASARASIELSVDARGAKLWALEQEPTATPNSRVIADRHFLVMGAIPIPVEQLARVVARADISSIQVRRNITVSIDRYAPDVAVLESVLDLLGALCGDASEPYR